jgi:hypothetical protein
VVEEQEKYVVLVLLYKVSQVVQVGARVVIIINLQK